MNQYAKQPGERWKQQTVHRTTLRLAHGSSRRMLHSLQRGNARRSQGHRAGVGVAICPAVGSDSAACWRSCIVQGKAGVLATSGCSTLNVIRRAQMRWGAFVDTPHRAPCREKAADPVRDRQPFVSGAGPPKPDFWTCHAGPGPDSLTEQFDNEPPQGRQPLARQPYLAANQ